jgi:hypothetical protein
MIIVPSGSGRLFCGFRVFHRRLSGLNAKRGNGVSGLVALLGKSHCAKGHPYKHFKHFLNLPHKNAKYS